MNRIAFYLFLFSIVGRAQHTLTYTDGHVSPRASLVDVQWIAGHWQGTAFGGITEEIWSPPLGDSMMFSFKLVIDDKVRFYELGHIQETGNTLLLQLRHFDGDLKAWEEKEEMESFPLVKLDAAHVYFDGFTFEKISDDEIDLYVVIVGEDGMEQEVKFNYKRQ
jgi:hypothetical protein